MNITSFTDPRGIKISNIKQTPDYIEFDVELSFEISRLPLQKPLFPTWNGKEAL